ncbi:carbohydrate ABC transporter permease [Oceanispirochaeta sp.]|jgi:multiple sugar transport system permease protein|uniref:carbohydrate ABC transporter permease n=1 Tax=Oceanispirochaeta sp. TaxID=2035350 RepID=UPI002609B0D5|nr:sugar ABC transporter permease [Oceanispirochaeta sp.]MDA3959102.1 sugar ABC transporter permease [Oceanispirochaeta sp.]
MISKKPVSALRKGYTGTVLLFLLPWLFSLIVFWYGPIFYTAVLSLMKYRLIGGGNFIGFDNYVKIFQDKYFWIGLQNTFVFILMFVPANLALGLFTAYLLNMDIKYKGLWRAIIYVPAVLPVVAVLVLGKFMFYPNGLINSVIEVFGIKGPLWLADPRLIKPASVMLMMWQCGTAMVVYLGALQGVPKQLYEAADIDGLGKTGQFMRVTIPMISPTILFRMVIDVIFGLMIFVPGLILPEGNVPGGPGTSSRFYALHIYEKAFQRFNLGEASALATILIILSMIITYFIMRMSNRYVHYEA